ncbi:MAG: NAD(P)H-nitrite reductase [Candidatus Riflebacteria bacterium]|nr:NAD(P)H-nitrite reductase [Candidatus Riflebacteria bacterium]
MGENEPRHMICYCQQVDERTIVAAIRNGARDLKSIQESTGAGRGNRCHETNPKKRCCVPDILELLEREIGAAGTATCACCRGQET